MAPSKQQLHLVLKCPEFVLADFVAADLEGIQDVVSEGANGVLVPARDAEGFVREILRFNADPSLLERSAVAARRSTLERFAWPVVVERYMEVLRGVVGTGA